MAAVQEAASSTDFNNHKESFWFRAHSEIPLVQSASSEVGHLYDLLKNKSGTFGIGVTFAEKCFVYAVHRVAPLTGGLRRPINLVDTVGCILLDNAKSRYPIILEPTNMVVESGTTAILRSSLAQLAFVSLDRVLGFAEVVVKLVPQVMIDDGCESENMKLASKALRPFRVCYSVATWPLRYTASILRDARRIVGSLSSSDHHSDIEESSDARIRSRRKISPRKRLAPKTLVQKLFAIPRYLFAAAGRMPCEQSKQIFASQIDTGTGDTLVSTISTEDKKRKYDCINSDVDVYEKDEFEECNSEDSDVSLAVLQTTLSSNSSVHDPDFVPEDISEVTSSLEYHSGSVEENDVELLEDDVAVVPENELDSTGLTVVPEKNASVEVTTINSTSENVN